MNQFLYHGSPVLNLKQLKPFTQATPTVENGNSPARVYAGEDTAYAAGQAFAWSTKEGVNLGFETNENAEQLLVLEVTKHILPRLEIHIAVYKLATESFKPLPHVAPFGHNFASEQVVSPLSFESFSSVFVAVRYYGGEVRIKE